MEVGFLSDDILNIHLLRYMVRYLSRNFASGILRYILFL